MLIISKTSQALNELFETTYTTLLNLHNLYAKLEKNL